jgi:hypothetical protein
VKGYSELNIFSPAELVLVERARRMVEELTGCPPLLRCHELARAVGRVLGLPFQDGQYGFVDHTWLWTAPLQKERSESKFRIGFPNILDVYSVGQVPMVRLVDCSVTALPHVGWAYRPTDERDDVDLEMVEILVACCSQTDLFFNLDDSKVDVSWR